MASNNYRPADGRARGNTVNSLQQGPTRNGPFKRIITREDAYSYALRAALLSYLLQPRQKRLQHVSAPPAVPKPVSRTSAMDLLKDFSGRGDQKGNKFPHGFMDALDKRVKGVLIGREKLPELNNDSLIKRSFGAFLNDFLNPVKRKSLERDRKMEDLLLIFYANGVKELQKGKASDDDSWKLMSDRHLAMFIRLCSSVLRDNDWAKDRPELTNRLQTMEKKILMHDIDLTSQNGGSTSKTIEVEVPPSFEVKDMPSVLAISRIFEKSYGQVQDDVNEHKAQWTEEAALKDLKIYQQCISLKTRATINFEDFDTEEAYELWKKNEIHEISQMLFSIIQINPKLAKTTTGTSIPQLQANSGANESDFADISRTLSEGSTDGFYSSFDSINMSGFNIQEDEAQDVEIPFTFIPPDQRLYYRAVAKEALMYDVREQSPSDSGDTPLISKKTAEILTELASRWRVPSFSRRILVLDAVRELYEDHDIGLETIDKAFIYYKEAPDEKKKAHRKSTNAHDVVSDWTKWTMKDLTMYQQCLSAIHSNLLRDLFQVMQGAYATKAPSFGMFLYVLGEHIYDEDLFPKSERDLDAFGERLSASLNERAIEKYQELLEKHLPKSEEEWEFYHVIELGKSVVNICDKIQKRYKKAPVIAGARPLMLLVKRLLPALSGDAQHLVERIMQNAKEEIPVSDGFDLYREFVEIRNVHNNVLPKEPFKFNVEHFMQEFVWRWLTTIEESVPGWVDGAIKQDQFHMISPPGRGPEEQRHSVSVFDVFRSFRESNSQLLELKWDDPYQNAKFFTKLAKAIGLGIARYCELVEQKFSREMDRLSPAQEAALKQSQQEKWLQLAKNTLAGKDKIDPFNFFPESLVKLNNIEYAMQNLDKLEQEIQVDKFAEIVRIQDEKEKKESELRNGPQRRPPRSEKYVFTIKIIEAEDLLACDLSGFSDPYVVLGDEYQKRLAKTRIIYRSLSPRWDETVDITTTGALNIVATIWDWDALGDHDCCGRTSLKLDPSLFKDFLPREYWLDLDTQGRLLLRVSMEGERDDIQFHFGKAFRTLKRTGGDMTRNITDKLSAYIRYMLSRQNLKGLLSKGIAVSVSSAFNSYFNRARSGTNPTNAPLTQADIASAINPLFDYFDENFAIMKQTLTDSAMIMVMTRLWKEVLLTLEALLVPPMSDKLSLQKPLTEQELDVVFKWLQLLFDFFHAVDEETGKAIGVPLDILKSPKYHDIKNLNFFYFQSTNDLIRTSEGIAAQSAARQQESIQKLNRLSVPSSLAPPAFGSASLSGSVVRRRKTVMLSRNLGTMRQAKEEKRKAAQAEPSDEYILRILRMRPEAERYLRDRERQKQRLAASQAAQAIVAQSMAGTAANRMMGGYGGASR